MIEVKDKESGAILFKRSPEQIEIDNLKKKIDSLERKMSIIEELITLYKKDS